MFRFATAAALAALVFGADAGRADAATRFTLAGADGIVVCGLSLQAAPDGAPAGTDANGEPAPAPGAVAPDSECASKFTTLPQMTKWTGGADGVPLLFLNEQGETMIEFQDIGDGIRVGRFPAGGIAYLSLDVASVDDGTDPASIEGTGGAGIAGTWTFARAADGSTPLCRVEMSEDEGASGMSALAPEPGCGDAIAELDLTGWELRDGLLSVHDSSGRQRLSFSQQSGPIWIRDPGGSRPLYLIRTGN